MAKKAGKVYLIGAGPGDPGLLTLKGRACLQSADAVVYDALVHPDILSWVSAGAKQIHVGKRGSSHTAEQEEINLILADLARNGKTVARLKGGDPFLFGRGGEEAEFLARRKIPFEVVPGVSSITAVPAYAGIPVTDRRLTSMLTVVTGHAAAEDSYDGPSVDWDRISPRGTLVILMGAARLPFIVKTLKSKGWPASLPVACVRWGTWPNQTVLSGTLGNILGKAKSAGKKFGAPVVIVVGKTAQLSRLLSWYRPSKK